MTFLSVCPCGLLRNVCLQLFADVSEQPIGPIFKVKDCLALEDGTDRLSRNVGKQVLDLYFVTTQKCEDLIYTGTEA